MRVFGKYKYYKRNSNPCLPTPIYEVFRGSPNQSSAKVKQHFCAAELIFSLVEFEQGRGGGVGDQVTPICSWYIF